MLNPKRKISCEKSKTIFKSEWWVSKQRRKHNCM